jgi:hypothetical protein
MITQESELGFGTEYEKVIFSEIVSRIGEKYGISSFLNFPTNNLLGNTEGITKTLSEKKENPDLLWNFCEFENEKDTESFFMSIEAFNPRHVLIVTQNRLNPGVLIHYFYHRIFGKKWDHGYLKKMTIKPIKEYSKSGQKYEVLEIGLFDAPWFILDVYEVGRYLKKLFPKSKQSADVAKTSLFEHSPKVIKNWASHHNYILLKYCHTEKIGA